MKRRRFLLATGALAAPFAALSQPSGRTLRVAILDDATEATQGHLWRIFLKRLGEMGYAEGKNLTVDLRYAKGAADRLPALAAELAALKPDIFVTRATPPSRAAKQAAKDVPIVFVAVADPVAIGLVASLASPGGNITGLSLISTELGAKWIELLRELAPGATRFAFIGVPDSEGSQLVYRGLQARAKAQKVTIQIFDGLHRKELARAFDAMTAGHYQGIVVGTAAGILDNQDQIRQYALRQKLPVVYSRREYFDAGGLLFYGVDLGGMYVRLADYVVRIARGAKPAELPVESPNIVRMAINLKTARAQGIMIPKSILVRADEVIE